MLRCGDLVWTEITTIPCYTNRMEDKPLESCHQNRPVHRWKWSLCVVLEKITTQKSNQRERERETERQRETERDRESHQEHHERRLKLHIFNIIWLINDDTINKRLQKFHHQQQLIQKKWPPHKFHTTQGQNKVTVNHHQNTQNNPNHSIHHTCTVGLFWSHVVKVTDSLPITGTNATNKKRSQTAYMT